MPVRPERPMPATDNGTDTDRQPPSAAPELTDSATVTDRRGPWLSPREAQQALGISERTLFRRIARGQYQRRHRGDSVEVCVPAARPSAPDTETVNARHVAEAERGLAVVDRFNHALAAHVAPLIAELATTRQQLVTLAQENGRLQAERDQLAVRVAALEERATVSSPDSDRQAATQIDNTAQAAITAPRPWWARLWRWHGGRAAQ